MMKQMYNKCNKRLMFQISPTLVHLAGTATELN